MFSSSCWDWEGTKNNTSLFFSWILNKLTNKIISDQNISFMSVRLKKRVFPLLSEDFFLISVPTGPQTHPVTGRAEPLQSLRRQGPMTRFCGAQWPDLESLLSPKSCMIQMPSAPLNWSLGLWSQQAPSCPAGQVSRPTSCPSPLPQFPCL